MTMKNGGLKQRERGPIGELASLLQHITTKSKVAHGHSERNHMTHVPRVVGTTG